MQCFVDGLHEMEYKDKEIMVKSAFEMYKVEEQLSKNQQYEYAMTEILRIESGEGRLQDKKKIKGLIEVAVTETEEVINKMKNELQYLGKQNRKSLKEAKIKSSFEVLDKACQMYMSSKAYKNNRPNTEKSVWEIECEQRFGIESLYNYKGDEIMSNKRIFREDEIFEICKAYAITVGDEFLTGEDLIDMNNEQLGEKIDSLSNKDKKDFMKQVDISVKEQLELFNSTPTEVMTEEDFEKHQEILSEVAEKWAEDFSDFIKW